ncbi:MAG: nitroreductase family protein [Chloroflexi bacterium]|nr:nitroreductase family protein [Chloroflexota bacterium]
MDYDGLLELVKKRRSIRKFRSEPIPDEYIDKIIEAARWAPSGANSQPWEFIVVRKQELRDEIAGLLKKQTHSDHRLDVEDAPVYIFLCGDLRARELYPSRGTIRADFTLYSSLASAFLYMHLAATSLGLASQWVSATAGLALQPKVKELLKMPEELVIYDMLALGYPAEEPQPRSVRVIKEMVHLDCYDKSLFRTEAKIKADAARGHHHHA